MKNKLTFAVLFIVCSAAVTGLFYLIFKQFSIAMICCSVSGAIFFGLLFAKIFVLSSQDALSIKNVVTLRAMTISMLLLFLWTVIYVFAFGDYSDAERDLTTLYIGYIVLFVLALLYCFMAGHSASTAEANNAAMQPCLSGKADLLALLQRTLVEVNNAEGSIQSENQKQMSAVINLAKSMPASVFENERNASLLVEKTNAVSESLTNAEDDTTAEAITKLLQTIKTIR
ncbi:MAG TPA: hypothetical protein DIW30_03900 [Bacteroidales bacterium]|nr:hypothetical protein [Bacteroidales bacterium]